MIIFRLACFQIIAGFIASAVILHFATGAIAANTNPVTQSHETPAAFEYFTKSSNTMSYQIDYSELDSFLNSVVVNFGPSERQVNHGLGKITGTRLRFGHYGKTALEGNRILFSMFRDENRKRATYLRNYLEILSEIIEFDRLTPDQQLSFWLNIYNITVIEQIADRYPVQYPSRIKIGDDKQSMFDAKIIRVSGVLLSLNDIQQHIVYKNWSDPRVIYGFFSGMAGGPNIRAFAYTYDQVWRQLDSNANEFINSLRGVREEAGVILVSEIYQRSGQLFANDNELLRNHLRQFANPEVMNILSQNKPMETAKFYDRIADLSGGQRVTATMQSLVSVSITQDGPILPLGTGRTLPPHGQQLMAAVQRKFRRLKRKGISPMVTIIDNPTLEEVMSSSANTDEPAQNDIPTTDISSTEPANDQQ